ncbi:hypothetical protein ACO2Q7_08585 [Rathayibacter sp. KR2-224]|uniref:hypothetical protein n=1 Tax=Rathayibacter sp. KR2-224 TaxID=3400913 RepID=UPI003C081159
MVTKHDRIDRTSLVRRHNPHFTRAHPTAVLTVGNGDLAATVDCTGLQTFADFHELRPDPARIPPSAAGEGLPPQAHRPFRKDDYQIPLRTQSSWGWYETPGRERMDPRDATTGYRNGRRVVPYLDRMGLYRPTDDIPADLEAAAWLHFNPRRLHLGRLALAARGALTAPGHPDELREKHLRLDLYSGTVEADYVLHGSRVHVTTTVHPSESVIATRVESDLLAQGLAVEWRFESQKDDLASFETTPETSSRWEVGHGRATAHRRVGSSSYSAELASSGSVEMRVATDGVVAHTTSSTLEVVVRLSEVDRRFRAQLPVPAAAEVFAAATAWWAEFWNNGAAVSFAGSSAPEADELERRVVLSQYLTAVNCAGATPPQETGLTLNSWSGKFHLEMHWWHAAHFALWGRPELLERSLGWYHSTLPVAREHARHQGYPGARWPKQTDPSGDESPSEIGAFIIWQQPHIIHLLELIRSRGRGVDFVQRHLPLVQATAEFMVGFVVEGPNGFELPPPLVPAQESYYPDRATTANPTFELAYWSWALSVANEWRRLCGKSDDEEWTRVAEGMRRPTVLPNGTYAAISNEPYVIREDHPSMLMAYGWLPPTELIDASIAHRTLIEVEDRWNLQSTWGWDYPVMSMTASRLGLLEKSLHFLVLDSPKNQYLENGHNPQRPGFLPVYLPSNGGLLAAIAHLVRAYESDAELPDGWRMTAEGF